MTLILLFLLQEAPTLEAAGSTSVPSDPCYLMTVSRSGKYLVFGRTNKLDVWNSEDLSRVRVLDRNWTGFGFDEKDEHLIVVDDDLVRLETKTWKEVSKETLEGIELRRPFSKSQEDKPAL